MGKPGYNMSLLVMALVGLMATQANASTQMKLPYQYKNLVCDKDPSEQTPLTTPKGIEKKASARADRKETPAPHVITLDVPGVNKDDIKIKMEENGMLRISGERKGEEEAEGDKWHRADRTNSKFWRQFWLPGNADLDHVNAHLENGVLRITVPKFAEEKKRQPKVINVAVEGSSCEGIKSTKAEL